MSVLSSDEKLAMRRIQTCRAYLIVLGGIDGIHGAEMVNVEGSL